MAAGSIESNWYYEWGYDSEKFIPAVAECECECEWIQIIHTQLCVSSKLMLNLKSNDQWTYENASAAGLQNN